MIRRQEDKKTRRQERTNACDGDEKGWKCRKERGSTKKGKKRKKERIRRKKADGRRRTEVRTDGVTHRTKQRKCQHARKSTPPFYVLHGQTEIYIYYRDNGDQQRQQRTTTAETQQRTIGHSTFRLRPLS